MPASAAASTERSIFSIGSVPQTFRVSSKHGACSAPTASSNSSARARMRAGSWLSGSFVTITSTPR